MKTQIIFKLAIALVMGLIIVGAAIASLPAGKVDAIHDLARTQHDVIVNYVPETYALTGTQTITPARSLYLLAPPTTLTATLGTGNALAGDIVIFINTVATSTIFSDAGDMLGTRTLDEDGDSIGFRFDGTEWVEQFFIDQSNGGGFDDLVATGTADLQGGIFNSTGAVTITDNAVVTGTTDLQGNISNSTGAITITDDAVVTGTTDLQGNISNSTGAITITDNAVVTGTTDLQGNISNSTGAITITDDAAVTGNLTLAGFELSTPESITPTDGGTITPTAGIVILTPAGEVTPTIAACTGGEHLILYNSESQTINLADSGNFVLTGALTMGQDDTLSLACIATKWVQLGPVSAN